MPSAEVIIGKRTVGPGSPLYFIAEAGSNHDGSFEQAVRLIDVAADAGADAVKFQAFRAASLYPKTAGASEYLKDKRSIYEIIRSLEMPLAWIAPLAAHCATRGVDFLCTPFDWEAADAIAPYVPAFKIASYDMTNYPLLQYVARMGKPIIVSTGTAEMEEVREMVAAVTAVANPGLVVLQCTAKYPAPLEALNVRALAELAGLGVPTGLSDHSREPLPGILAAVSLGASVIEKHFTLSNALPGPDHAYALEPHELKDVVAKVRQVERALGSGRKTVHPEERELRAFARRTIMTARAVEKGERLRRSDVAILRCGSLPYGLHPKEYTRILGRTAVRALGSETPIVMDDVGGLRLKDDEVSVRLIERADGPWIRELRAGDSPEGRSFTPVSGPSDDWFDAAMLRADRLEFVFQGAAGGATGLAGLFDIDWVANTAELGLLLSRARERPQSASAACRVGTLLIAHAFDSLGLDEVRYTVVGGEPWSRELADRLGFAPSAGGWSRLRAPRS